MKSTEYFNGYSMSATKPQLCHTDTTTVSNLVILTTGFQEDFLASRNPRVKNINLDICWSQSKSRVSCLIFRKGNNKLSYYAVKCMCLYECAPEILEKVLTQHIPNIIDM